MKTNVNSNDISIPQMKLAFSQVFNIFGWILSLITMLIVIFANYPLQQLNTTATPDEFAFYDAYSRVFWSIALCYIIFACVHGHGGLINSFLSHPLWQPLSRLSYSIYLLHLVVMMVTTASMKTPLYFSELNAVSVFRCNFLPMTNFHEYCFVYSFSHSLEIMC